MLGAILSFAIIVSLALTIFCYNRLFLLILVFSVIVYAVMSFTDMSSEQYNQIKNLYNEPKYEECKKYVDKKVPSTLDARDYLYCVKKVDEVLKYKQMRGE